MSIEKNTPHFLRHSGLSFTTLLNKTLDAIQNPATLGIYVYLSSKPNDWQISETNLMNRFSKGRDFIRERLSELKKLGLLKSIPIKNEKGVIIKWETVLYNEIPHIEIDLLVKTQITENPGTWKTQDPGKPTHLEKPPTTNKRDKQIKENNITPIVPKGDDVRFEEFWSLYPVQKAKKSCIEKWRKKKLDDIADDILDKLVMQIANDRAWIDGFVPNPLTYINQERWTDELDTRTKRTNPKQQSTDSFHNTMAKYKKVPTDGYYDEYGNFTANYL